jgi:nucleoside 2-deoxyribosyltransferase
MSTESFEDQQTDGPLCFIASPLFNPPQLEIISHIEGLLEGAGYRYYSARKHSGSDKMTPEQRKDLRAWDPVFQSNIDGLNRADFGIAVLEYALPDNQGMLIVQDASPGIEYRFHEKSLRVELPDAGTVWEMGYLAAQGKPVIGFHTDKAKHLNLMLSHGVAGLVLGYDALAQFLGYDRGPYADPQELLDWENARPRDYDTWNRPEKVYWFDWRATHQWDATTKEVE